MTKLDAERAPRRARVALLAVGFVCAIRVASAAIVELQVSLLHDLQQGIRLAPGVAAANDARVRFVSLLGFAAYCVAGVLFLRWVHAAHERARRLNEKAPFARSPGSCVWSYFIPVVALVRPLEDMRALSAASDPRDLELPPVVEEKASPGYRDAAATARPRAPWKSAPIPVGAWWAAFLGMQLMAFVVGASSRGAAGSQSLDSLVSTSRVIQLHDASAVLAGALVVLVVSGIDRAQRERGRRRRLIKLAREQAATAD
jgi:hypothetical protein